MQRGPAVALHFRVLGGAIRPKRANFGRLSGLYRRSNSNCQAGRNISRFTTLSGNGGLGAPKAPWLGKKSKLFLSIGVGTATFAASAYTNQALASPSSPVEVATSPSGKVAPGPSLSRSQSTTSRRLKGALKPSC